MPCQCDCIGGRGGAGADHQPVEREPGLFVGRHHGLALLERKRGRLAGGAEHVQPITAGVEQEACKFHRARRIRRAGFIDRGGDGGHDAAKGILNHLIIR